MELDTKNPHAGSAGASNVLGRNTEASSSKVQDRASEVWAFRLQEYRKLDAELALHCAYDSGDDPDYYEAESNRLASLHADAIDDLMLIPAPTVGAFIEKVEIFHRNGLADGWWRGTEIMAIMACDAERLLRIHHKSRGEP